MEDLKQRTVFSPKCRPCCKKGPFIPRPLLQRQHCGTLQKKTTTRDQVFETASEAASLTASQSKIRPVMKKKSTR
jgi:hypothetical protein